MVIDQLEIETFEKEAGQFCTLFKCTLYVGGIPPQCEQMSMSRACVVKKSGSSMPRYLQYRLSLNREAACKHTMCFALPVTTRSACSADSGMCSSRESSLGAVTDTGKMVPVAGATGKKSEI